MSLHLITRVAVAAVLVAGAGTYAAAELKGDYKVEFVVQDATYSGTAKAIPGTKGAVTGKFDFTSPSAVAADFTGKTAGDSLTFEAKYVDNGRNCSGSLTGRGTVEKDGSKAAGTLAINDSCSGDIDGTFKLWR